MSVSIITYNYFMSCVQVNCVGGALKRVLYFLPCSTKTGEFIQMYTDSSHKELGTF